jgi:hypothetical protein
MLPERAAYRSGKQPAFTPANVPEGTQSPRDAGSQAALDGALIADDEQEALLRRDLGEAFADRIAGGQHERVVVEKGVNTLPALMPSSP